MLVFRQSAREIAKTMGLAEKEALKLLVGDNLRTMEKADDRFKMLEKRFKRRHQRSGT